MLAGGDAKLSRGRSSAAARERQSRRREEPWRLQPSPSPLGGPWQEQAACVRAAATLPVVLGTAGTSVHSRLRLIQAVVGQQPCPTPLLLQVVVACIVLLLARIGFSLVVRRLGLVVACQGALFVSLVSLARGAAGGCGRTRRRRIVLRARAAAGLCGS